jgi:voltage-gated potassium channel Kch
LLIDATIIIGHGLLAVLFASLLAALGGLLGILDGDVGWCSPVATQGRVKLGRLGANNVLSGDSASFFGGALGGIG